MRVAVLTGNEKFVSALRSVAREDNVMTVDWYNHPDQFMESVSAQSYKHAVIMDDQFSPPGWEEFLDWLYRYCPSLPVTILLSQRPEGRVRESFWKSCLARRLEAIHLSADPCEELASVIRLIGGGRGPARSDRRRGRLAMFIGSTPNIGTTLVSFGTAVRLASETDCTIGYLCLNLKSSKIHRYIGRDEPVCTLDTLRAELRSRSLQRERLLQSCETFAELPGLYVLPGNMIREQAEFFSTEDIEHLLDTALQTFDVVIAEVNAYWDNAATVVTACRADRRLYVTGGDIAQFQEDTRRWLYSVSTMIALDPASFDLIVNSCDIREHSGIQAKDIARETGMQLLASVGRHAEAGLAANEGRLLSYFRGQPSMNGELSGVVEVLIALFGLTRPSPSVRKRWHFRLLSQPAMTGRVKG